LKFKIAPEVERAFRRARELLLHPAGATVRRALKMFLFRNGLKSFREL